MVRERVNEQMDDLAEMHGEIYVLRQLRDWLSVADLESFLQDWEKTYR
jgi:hypothetical protein